jgi:CheY-like chemotaxis protein
MPALRVLVVDDNPLIRRLLDLMLEDQGHHPIDAESGELALAIALSDPPDLCIVDEMMPAMHGSDVIRALRRAGDPRVATMPVVGISGRPDGARVLLSAGATAFVSKPVEEGAFLAAVTRALASRPPAAEASVHSP